MKTNFYTRTIALLALILFSNLSFAQQKDYKKELDILFNAFKNKDYELMQPLLTADVKISDKIPVGMNDIVVPQVLAQVPAPDSYTIIKTETINGNQKITTEYNYTSRNKRLQYFTFNSEGKVIDLDILSDATKVEAQYNMKVK